MLDTDPDWNQCGSGNTEEYGNSSRPYPAWRAWRGRWPPPPAPPWPWRPRGGRRWSWPPRGWGGWRGRWLGPPGRTATCRPTAPPAAHPAPGCTRTRRRRSPGSDPAHQKGVMYGCLRRFSQILLASFRSNYLLTAKGIRYPYTSLSYISPPHERNLMWPLLTRGEGGRATQNDEEKFAYDYAG